MSDRLFELLRSPGEWALYVDVSPELAERLIAASTTIQNRSLKKAHLDQIAEDITLGRWRTNGESIVFDPQGRVVDGNHRLHAIAKAGKTVRLLCTGPGTGDLIGSIDRGHSRDNGDDLQMKHGLKNGKALAAALGVLYRHEKKALAKTTVAKSPPFEEMEALYAKNPDMVKSVDFVRANRTSGRGIMPDRFVAMGHYCMSQKSPEAAERFMTELLHGSGLQEGSPVLALRQSLINTQISRQTLSEFQHVIMLWNAWNSWVAGETKDHVKRLRPHQDSKLPKLADLPLGPPTPAPAVSGNEVEAFAARLRSHGAVLRLANGALVIDWPKGKLSTPPMTKLAAKPEVRRGLAELLAREATKTA